MNEPGAILQDRVISLLAMEKAITEGIDLQAELTLPYKELSAALAAIRSRAHTQHRVLSEYLDDASEEQSTRRSAITALLTDSLSPGTVGDVLSADLAAFSFAAGEYSLLAELSLRLYDPTLRALAPQHLRSYAEAVLLLTQLLPSVIVQKLDNDGLDCRCICPTCSVGACGCTAAGQSWIKQAWDEARPQVVIEPGLLLSPPRRGSGLAQNGVRGGDLLLEVDGQPITTFVDVQTAIRKHEIGGEVVLRIARGSELPRSIRVPHVSDYPPD